MVGFGETSLVEQNRRCTVFGSLEQALMAPSTPTECRISGEALVVVDYTDWKQHILESQALEGKEDGQ